MPRQPVQIEVRRAVAAHQDHGGPRLQSEDLAGELDAVGAFAEHDVGHQHVDARGARHLQRCRRSGDGHQIDAQAVGHAHRKPADEVLVIHH